MDKIEFNRDDVEQMVEFLLKLINDPNLSVKQKKRAYFPYMVLETALITQLGEDK